MVVLAAASPPGAYAMCMCRASDDDLAAEGERFSKRFGAALDEIIEIRDRVLEGSRIPPSCAREETRERRGMPCLFLNTERGFGGKPPKKSGFRRHLAGSKMPKEGSKMPKE